LILEQLRIVLSERRKCKLEVLNVELIRNLAERKVFNGLAKEIWDVLKKPQG
jgi:hypothetical protein